jgi:hypothetical protein
MRRVDRLFCAASSQDEMTDDFDGHPALARRGKANPEKTDNPLWLGALRNHLSAWTLREAAGVAYPSKPVWSWRRFGRTRTSLPDGRIVSVGGEHEDFYDPDFYVYNDVVVQHPDGRVAFYLYPTEVFPPTDFHSATLIGDWIWLVGALCYQGARGETIQVMRLDIRDFHIERVATTGEAPGWLSGHRAERLDGTRILVVGGRYFSDISSKPNHEIFELDIAQGKWRRRPHGDVTLFPISCNIYEACKSPRPGRTNPEKSDNPFWLEMARRRWLPSRARLHFGDFGLDDPKRPPSREEIDALPPDTMFKRKMVDGPKVWSARRVEMVLVALDDGRKLRIGGAIRDFEEGFEEEWPDVWNYADVIVERPDGEIDIFIYPTDIFPPLSAFCAVPRPGCVLIFGDVDRSAGQENSGPVLLRLDTRTFEITVVEAGGAPPRAIFHPGCLRVEGDLALFELLRDTGDQIRRYAAFDLAKLRWRDDATPHDGGSKFDGC